jgi:Domain of unknown function (DUF4868)
LYNFFALVRDETAPVRRLPVSQQLQEDLARLFREQRHDLLGSGRDTIDYTPSYSRDEDEILCIRNFQVPAEIASAAEQPALCPPLEITNPHEDIRAIIATDFQEGEYLFQTFDRRREISTRRFSIILSSNTFRRLEEPGLTLDSKLAAVVILSKVLIFESYYEARRVLNLTEYYREATDEDLRAFCSHEKLTVEEIDGVMKIADSWIRKKVALITQSQVLDNNTPQNISKVAKAYGIDISLSGTGNRKKLMLPSNKKDLKNFLRFLDEDFYTSALSSNRFLANSKRRWP